MSIATQGVRAGVHETRPGDQAEGLRALVQRHRAGYAQQRQPTTVGAAASEPAPKVVAIASGKGGVGKTSIGVNLAATLAGSGRRVLLVDGDLGIANADLLCGLRIEGNLGHAMEGVLPLKDIVVDAPGGFRLAPGGAGVARLAAIDSARAAALADRLAGLERDADIVVVDCGAGVGPGVLAFLGAADVGLLVTTPEPTAMTGAYATLKCAVHRCKTKRGAQHGGLAFAPVLFVNQAKCEQEAKRVHERVRCACGSFLGLDLPLAGWAPVDPRVARAVRERRPFVLAHPGGKASVAIGRLAADVQRRLACELNTERPRGLLGRLARGLWGV